MRVLAIYNTNRIVGGGEISFTLTLTALRSAGCDILAGVPSLPNTCTTPLKRSMLQYRPLVICDRAAQTSLKRLGLDFIGWQTFLLSGLAPVDSNRS